MDKHKTRKNVYSLHNVQLYHFIHFMIRASPESETSNRMRANTLISYLHKKFNWLFSLLPRQCQHSVQISRPETTQSSNRKCDWPKLSIEGRARDGAEKIAQLFISAIENTRNNIKQKEIYNEEKFIVTESWFNFQFEVKKLNHDRFSRWPFTKLLLQ